MKRPMHHPEESLDHDKCIKVDGTVIRSVV